MHISCREGRRGKERRLTSASGMFKKQRDKRVVDDVTLRPPIRRVYFWALRVSKNEAIQKENVLNHNCFSINHLRDSLSCIQTCATEDLNS